MKGFKTLLLNGAITLVPIIDYIANSGGLVTSIVGGGNAPVVLSLIGLANVVLRWMTTTPVLKSE